jgi:hypothetical protein
MEQECKLDCSILIGPDEMTAREMKEKLAAKTQPCSQRWPASPLRHVKFLGWFCLWQAENDALVTDLADQQTKVSQFISQWFHLASQHA